MLLLLTPVYKAESLPAAGTLERVRSLGHWRTLPSRVRWLAQGRSRCGERRLYHPGQPLLMVHTGQYFSQLLDFCPTGVAVQRALAFILVVLQMAHSLALCAPSLRLRDLP